MNFHTAIGLRGIPRVANGDHNRAVRASIDSDRFAECRGVTDESVFRQGPPERGPLRGAVPLVHIHGAAGGLIRPGARRAHRDVGVAAKPSDGHTCAELIVWTGRCELLIGNPTFRDILIDPGLASGEVLPWYANHSQAALDRHAGAKSVSQCESRRIREQVSGVLFPFSIAACSVEEPDGASGATDRIESVWITHQKGIAVDCHGGTKRVGANLYADVFEGLS